MQTVDIIVKLHTSQRHSLYSDANKQLQGPELNIVQCNMAFQPFAYIQQYEQALGGNSVSYYRCYVLMKGIVQ